MKRAGLETTPSQSHPSYLCGWACFEKKAKCPFSFWLVGERWLGEVGGGHFLLNSWTLAYSLEDCSFSSILAKTATWGWWFISDFNWLCTHATMGRSTNAISIKMLINKVLILYGRNLYFSEYDEEKVKKLRYLLLCAEPLFWNRALITANVIISIKKLNLLSSLSSCF